MVVIIIAAQVNLACDGTEKEVATDEYEIKTGDILGVGYTHAFGWFVTAWSASIWSHTGIAWRDPQTGELFVLEAAMYGKKYRDVFRIPFRQWLRINRKHHLCHLRLRGNTDRGLVDKLDREFKKYEEGVKLDSFNPGWYRFLRTTPYREEELREKYVCYEITIAVLQAVGIFKKKSSCSSYFAGHIINRNIPTEHPYYYEDAVGLEPIDLRLGYN